MPSAVILTAIPVEYHAVRKHLSNRQPERHPQGTIYERGKYGNWDVLVAEVGAGNTLAAVGTRDAIAHFQPDVILFVGVAGGIKDLVVGDVVVATKVYYYEFGKAEEAEIARRPEVLNVDSQLMNLAKYEAKQSDWLKRLNPAPNTSPSVLVKPIASGEKVIASTKSREYQLLRQYYNDAIAVEMEGYGFLYAVSRNQPKVPALIIRGISDLIDGKSAADAAGSQQKAAAHASAFAFEILAKLNPRSNPAPTPPQISTNPKFSFDVVTVNAWGEIIKRETKQAEYFTEKLTQGVTLEMVKIPGGTFIMGSPETEAGSFDRERPQHQVTIQPFYMAKYAVTQAQWQAVARLPQVNRELNPDPSRFKGNNRPVETISWYDAVEFCERLSLATGRNYRLPSEAEWEYACRAGTTTPFHFGQTITPELANYNGKYTYSVGAKGELRQQTTDVGSFKVANAFGLDDMHGNVWEWCADNWHRNYEGATEDGKVWLSDNDNQIMVRGGSWCNDPLYCRCAFRHKNIPDDKYFTIGFRVVCAVGRTYLPFTLPFTL